MSTFRNPVGPQPSRVYWRRRLVVLIALIIALILVIAVISAVASGSSKATAPKAEGGASATPTQSAAASPSSPVVAGAACAPARLKVLASTDKASYAPGENPKLSFSITNTGTVACTFNVGSTQQTYVVASGAEQYWSSKDCETAPVDTPLLLQPNVAMTATAISWDRTRSSTTTCATSRAAAPGGGATYTLTVSVGAVKSVTPKAFLLN